MKRKKRSESYRDLARQEGIRLYTLLDEIGKLCAKATLLRRRVKYLYKQAEKENVAGGPEGQA